MESEIPAATRAKWDDKLVYDLSAFVTWVLSEGRWYDRFQGGQWDWAVVKKAAVQAAEWSKAKWKPGSLPMMTYVKRGIEMRMQTLLKSAFERGLSVEAQTFENRDLEEFAELATAADEVLRPVMEKDEVDVLTEWCKGQGRAGQLLMARLSAETAEELAAKHGLSASQVHRILTAVMEVARERFRG